MKELNDQDMQQIFESVLEKMAFAFPDDVEDEDQSFDRHVHIRFAGIGGDGEVVLSATDGFLGEFASSMLGVEIDQIAVEDGAATLRELANVICGEVAHHLGGETKRIRLGLPEESGDPFDPAPNKDHRTHTVAIEGEPVRAVVFYAER